MMGLVSIGDSVKWQDENGVHTGRVDVVYDDATYAEIYEHDISDWVVLPVAMLEVQD